MGKASRRRRTTDDSGAPAKRQRTAAVPYVNRPFEGLPQETEWVAIREILPAATAVVSFADGQAPEGVDKATIATVLPLAWPALHRADGTVLVGTQAGSSTGDPSRDLAAQILAGAAAETGSAVQHVPAATADTPRLQDLLDLTRPSRSRCTRASTSGSTEPTSTTRAASRSSAPTSRSSPRRAWPR